MVKQVINVGANANDGTGDDLRAAMQKINTNFTELYGTTAEANDLVEDGTPQLGGNLDIQNYIITTNTTNGTISIQPNGSGAVLLKNIRITDNVISSDDSTNITINDSLIVTGSVSTPTLYTNVIQSDDSSVVQINDGVTVSGTLKSNSVITNSLSSDDSSAIEIAEDLLVSGTVSTESVRTNSLYSEAIQIVDNNISTRRSNDDLVLSPSGTGSVNLRGAKITNLGAPTANGDAATKQYVDGVVLDGLTSTSITLVGDDSTGTAISLGESFKIAGTSNITTAVSGDTLTITGPNLSSYLTDVTINVVADDSNTISINNGGTLLFNGEQGITTSTSSSGSVTITGPNLSSYATTSYVTSQGYITNSPITIVGDDSTGVTLNSNETIKIAGSGGVTTSVSGDTLTIDATLTGGTLANLSVTDQTISGTTTNGDINITPNGTGDINLTVGGQVKITDGTNDYSGVIGVANSLARYNYGISSFSYNDFNLSAFDRHRVYANSLAGHISLLGTDPVNAQIAWRGLQVDLFTDAEGRSLSSRGSAVADPSSKTSLNSGGEISTYSLGPVALGVTNQLRNTSASPSYLPEGLGIFSFAEFVNEFDTYGNGSITFEDYNNFNAATNLASASGTATITNLVGYRAGGNYFTDGTGNVTNYYAFYANGISEGTNNYGIYVESEDWENYLGGLVIKNSTIAANRTNENLYLRTAGTGKVIVDDSLQVVNTLTANTFVTNDISSADSSAIQINDSVNISGTLSVDTIDTNVISSSDSSAITVNDDLEVKSQLFVNTISSNDSSAIQILDNVECNANLYANDITGTVVQFGSSGSPVNTNQTINMSSGRHFEIWLSADITCTLTNYTYSTLKTVFVKNTSGSAKVLTFNGTYSTGGAINYSTTLAAGREILLYLVGGKDNVFVAESDINAASDIFVNSISSPDSSAITINDSVNISGVLSANTIDTNTISSSDNSTIQINDSVQISDNLTMGGLLTLSNKTVAQLLLLTPAAGTVAYCTDETGGAQPVFYDGTNWRRMTDRITIS